MRLKVCALLFILCAALPSFAQHRQPVATTMSADGKVISVDFRESDLLTPEPQHVSIQKQVVIDFQCVPLQPNPPSGNDRFYCDAATGLMVCQTSTGANCLPGGGGGGGSGTVTSVGLAAPTGIVVTNSPVTTTGTLTWAMPAGWVLGDLLIGNGSNSVARLAAPTTPDLVTQTLISTPSSGATLPQWGPAGLPGRVVSITSDTIIATDRNPETVEYTSNSPTAITVPDPASTGFNGNPAFVTIAEGVGPYTFTPQTSAVITYCDGSNCFAGQPSLTLQKGQYATWSSPTTSNWIARVASTQPIAQPPVVNGLISGGGVTWTGGLNFTCSAAVYAIGGTVYNSPQTNLTLVNDPSNPRIDVVVVNNSGVCTFIPGTPAGSPAAPSVDPTSQLSLTFVTIAANASTPTLNSILVYDENSTPPTEYTCTPSANFNCNSTSNPFHLTHDIEATTAVATNNVALVNSSAISFATYSTLSFNIRNKASWPSAKSLQICFLNSTTVVGNCIAFKNGVYGFDQTNVTGYQQIVIPLSAFALGSTVADRVQFKVLGSGGSIGFYLDWIQIQSNLSGSGATGFQLQVNGANTQLTANLNGTTPAAQANNLNVTFQKSDSNGMSSVSAELPYSSTGVLPGLVIPSVTPTNGDCMTWSVAAGIIKAGDTGGACGGSPGGGIIGYSASSLTLTAATRYFPIVGGGLPSTTETDVDTEAPSAATISNFYASTSVAFGVGNSAVFTYRNNASDQSMTCTISGASATSCNDSTHSFNVAKGDLVTIKVVTTGTIVVSPTLVMTAQFGTTGSNGTVNAGTQGQLGYYAAAGTAISGAGPGTAKQVVLSNGTSGPQFIDFPDMKYIPAAENVNGTAGFGWTCPNATPAALLRAGTNNKDALLSPWGASDLCYIKIQLAKDWDTASNPYLMIELTSTDATNGHTIIMQESVACAKLDGTTTDDVAFNAARSFSTVTLNGNANRTWEADLALNNTDMTGCSAPGIMWIKISRTTDTATNVGVWGMTATVPRLLTVQAN